MGSINGAGNARLKGSMESDNCRRQAFNVRLEGGDPWKVLDQRQVCVGKDSKLCHKHHLCSGSLG